MQSLELVAEGGMFAGFAMEREQHVAYGALPEFAECRRLAEMSLGEKLYRVLVGE